VSDSPGSTVYRRYLVKEGGPEIWLGARALCGSAANGFTVLPAFLTPKVASPSLVRNFTDLLHVDVDQIADFLSLISLDRLPVRTST
jgi:hypothetical protein